MSARFPLGPTAIFVLAASGCGGNVRTTSGGGTTSSTDTTTTTASAVCTPGQQAPCACPGGTTGTQTCAADGSHFEACLCGGSGGTGGTGGSGGTMGAGASGGSGGAGGGPTTTSTATSPGSPCDPVCAAISGVPSQCVAIADNAIQKAYAFRMAQVDFQKPDGFTAGKSPVIAGLLAESVTINLIDCNLNGKGTFSWLLEFDTVAGSLKMGGAPVLADPTSGYCYLSKAYGNFTVAPATMAATLDASGKLGAATGADVVLPMFLTDPNNPILLPLSDARVDMGQISPDHNCIGKYNADQLDPGQNCQPNGNLEAFTDGGSLRAFITLEKADAVLISDLKETLCVLLTGENDGANPKKCKRDASGKITSKGDWCAATNMAASPACADAFDVDAKFAASAVKINGSCN